jgi:hypothetical protein
MTYQEQRNIEAAKLFIELYNTDIDRLVHECYTANIGVGSRTAVNAPVACRYFVAGRLSSATTASTSISTSGRNKACTNTTVDAGAQSIAHSR